MIESLRIRNFKCFEDQLIPFGHLTLLTGLNSTGKSSILQALLLLRQSEEQTVLRQTGLALNGAYVNIGTAKDALFERAKDDAISFELRLTDGTLSQWNFSAGMQNSVNSDINADVIALTSNTSPEAIYSCSLFNHSFHYLTSERIGPRVSFPVSDYIVKRQRQLGIHGEYAPNFLTTFEGEDLSIPQLAHIKEPSLKLRDQVEAWLGEICPGIRIHYTPYSAMDAVNLQFSFTSEKDTTKQFRASNVGFGVTFVLSILVALLSSQPGNLILCENPEAYLHPKGQRRIGELIALTAEMGVQIILETHSDHVLNGVRLAAHNKVIKDSKVVRTHYFERVGGDGIKPCKMSSPELTQSGRYNFWPSGFFDEFASALDELLEPPR